MSVITMENLFEEVKFKRKVELQQIVENIILTFSILGGGKLKLGIWGKQRLEQTDYVKSIELNDFSLSFYVSKSDFAINRIELQTSDSVNFNDLFKDDLYTSIRHFTNSNLFQAYFFARPLMPLSEQQIIDFCGKVLLLK